MLAITPKETTDAEIEARARSMISRYGSREAERLAFSWMQDTFYLPTGGTERRDNGDADKARFAETVKRLNEAEGVVACPPFGPDYNISSSGLDKFRRLARKSGGVAKLEKAERHAYGEAVEKAILAKQRSDLQRELPGHACLCASGTWHSDGAAIIRAVQAQQRAALQACPSRNAGLSAGQWQDLYEETMKEKRNRVLTTKKPPADCPTRAADSAVPAAQRGKPHNGAAKMPERSKIYPVKSNAARAAAQYGIPRSNLFEASNPEAGLKGWAFTIPDGVKPTPQKKAAKAEGGAAEPKPKAAKPAKKPKAAKPAKPARTKAKTKPVARRKSGAKTGKTAAFIAECKKGYVSADDAMKRYNWNSNTLRGVLGNYKLATAKTDAPMSFVRKREDGVTYYRVVSVETAEKLAKAA